MSLMFLLYRSHSSFASLVSRLVAFAVLALLPLAACDRSPSGPAAEAYVLSSINGAPLPAAVSMLGESPPNFEVTSGSLTLRADGALTEVIRLRCRTELAPGTDCHVEGDGSNTRHGTYSAAEGWVRFGDVQFPLEIAAGRATVSYVYPPSLGSFQAQYDFEYRR